MRAHFLVADVTVFHWGKRIRFVPDSTDPATPERLGPYAGDFVFLLTAPAADAVDVGQRYRFDVTKDIE